MGIRKLTVIDPKAPKPRGRKETPTTQDPGNPFWGDASFANKSISLARAVYQTAQNIERYGWVQRYRNHIYNQFLLGRSLDGAYSYSTVRRPSAISSVINSQWRPPTMNMIGLCSDVYSARIFKNRPYLQVVPLGDGGFEGRMRSEDLSKFADAVFDATKFFTETAPQCGKDAMAAGSAVVKVHENQNQKGQIAITRVLVDELLISDEEATYGDPSSMLQRVFMSRRDLLARFGKDTAAALAIRNAASVYPAFGASADTSYKTVVPLIEGWSKPLSDGTPGRHVLCIPNYVLVDETYDRHFFPFAILKFQPVGNSYRGQGLVEQTIGLQNSLDRVMAVIDECNERVAYPRVAIEAGSQVNIEQLEGVPGGAYSYVGTAPQWINPPAVSPETFKYRDSLKQDILQKAGISENAAGGTKPPGLNSGVALMANAQIDDTRHSDLAQAFEDWVTQVGMLVFAVAEDVKPKVQSMNRFGGTLDWNDVRLQFDPRDLTSSAFKARAFPMSKLPQTIAGREQIVQDWLANGQITRANAMRMGLLPDIESFGNLATAAADQAEWTLDQMVRYGKFISPTPFGDLSLTLQMAQSRWLYESIRDTPKDRLRTLAQFISATQDLISDNTAPPAPVGVQGAPAPLAPSPLQLAPASGNPTPLPAAA